MLCVLSVLEDVLKRNKPNDVLEVKTRHSVVLRFRNYAPGESMLILMVNFTVLLYNSVILSVDMRASLCYIQHIPGQCICLFHSVICLKNALMYLKFY